MFIKFLGGTFEMTKFKISCLLQLKLLEVNPINSNIKPTYLKLKTGPTRNIEVF